MIAYWFFTLHPDYAFFPPNFDTIFVLFLCEAFLPRTEGVKLAYAACVKLHTSSM